MNEIVNLEKNVLEKNDLLAQNLRNSFAEAQVAVSNWVSSPGTGKTELLQAVLTRAIEQGISAAALVGDCATDNDAKRLAQSGAPVRQIVTEGMCHLEADMIAGHLSDWTETGWSLTTTDFLVIENVGNLVCPSGFDLGEGLRVALLSVTEGEDKPVKYPQIFHSADIIIVTKIDLAAAVEWDVDRAYEALRAVNPDAPIIETSARRGLGIDEVLAHLIAAAPATARQFIGQETP